MDNRSFNPLAGDEKYTCILPKPQIGEVVCDFQNRDKIAIGVQWREDTNVIKFLMGNFATISIPCSEFTKNENGAEPDFSSPWIGDFGSQVLFGKYEVDLNKVFNSD